MSAWKATFIGTPPNGESFVSDPLELNNLEELGLFMFFASREGFYPANAINAINLGMDPETVELNIDQPFTLLPSDESWAAQTDAYVEVTPL